LAPAQWLRQPGEFYISLIRDREFQEAVQDIVVEFASRNNQPLRDNMSAVRKSRLKRYATFGAIRRKWRLGNRPFTLNASRNSRSQRLDPDTHLCRLGGTGQQRYLYIGGHRNEVLKRRHRALVVLGSNHVTKSGGRDGTNTTTRVEARYPGSTYALLLLNAGPLRPALEDKLKLPSRNGPAVYELNGNFSRKCDGWRLASLDPNDRCVALSGAAWGIYDGIPRGRKPGTILERNRPQITD
jgi:hypothetical protein